ncbi:MAG TPA: HEAT repeat domain-containing protein, partial [Planctomycetota bacterium]|nr:HEAT repeat domain-containing protein [Planctomycetota bacterium]
MANELERICKLLDDGDAELQIAVARVLRELRPKDAAARKSLVGALKSQNEMVRLYALEALAAIDVDAALPHVVPMLGGSEAVRARASQILIGAGAAAAKALRDHLDAKDPQVRKGILDILGQLPGVDTTDSLFAGLLDPDLDVVKRAAQAYRQRIESMPAADQAKALKKILEFMESAKVQKAKTPLASCLLIVGALRNAAAVKPVLRYLDKKMPPAVRNHALLALFSLPLEGKDAAAAVTKLLPLLEESEFNEIVKPALDILWKLPPGTENADRLLKLLKSSNGAVRMYAVKALGSVGSASAGGALVDALLGDDPRLGETADGALRGNPDFIPALLKSLDQQEDMGKAFKIVNVLKAFKNVLDKSLVKKFLAKTFSMLDKKESGFQTYFEIVRAAAPELAKKEVVERGRDLLKSKDFEDAERVLRLVQNNELSSAESDLAMGMAQLRQQRLDPANAGRDTGNALGHFLRLSRSEGFNLLKQLEKEAGLISAEGLLYLGFAFTERQGADRDLGGAILKLVAKKFGSKPEGKVAKQKLKTQGI